MAETPRIDRREFTVDAVLLALAGVTITISGCGGGGGGDGYSAPSAPTPPTPSPTPAGAADEAGSISDNHGHSAVVSAAQLAAGSTFQLDIRGAADHPHTVTLTADALQAIKGGHPIRTESTTASGHAHTVTFNADSSEPPERY